MTVLNTHPDYLPTTGAIHQAFREEIESLGGRVSDVFDDGVRLFARGVLDSAVEVRPGDQIRGGVALRTAGPEVLVHPYTLRVVCTNGAIQARSLESRCISRIEVAASTASAAAYESAAALAAIGETVRACAAPEAFCAALTGMHSAAQVEMDDVLSMISIFRRLGGGIGEEYLSRIIRTFLDSPDPGRTVFGVQNAVTSVARDTRDPEKRWQLEELGGAVPALLVRAARAGRPGRVLQTA